MSALLKRRYGCWRACWELAATPPEYTRAQGACCGEKKLAFHRWSQVFGSGKKWHVEIAQLGG